VVYFNEYHRPFSLFLFVYAVGFLLTGWLSRPRSDDEGRFETAETARILSTEPTAEPAAAGAQ